MLTPETPDEQAAFFNENGYCIIPDAVAPDVLRALQDETDQAIKAEPGVATVRNLLSRSEGFAPLIDGHRGMPLLETIIGDVQLLAMDLRTCFPGGGDMDWHVDLDFFSRGSVISVNTALYLDDLTPDNGALRVVPCSHLTPFTLSRDEMRATLPGETLVTCPAGTLVVFSDNLWHRTGPNITERPRRGIFTYYGHFWMKQTGYRERPEPLRHMRRYIDRDDPKRQQIMGAWMNGSEFNPVEDRA